MELHPSVAYLAEPIVVRRIVLQFTDVIAARKPFAVFLTITLKKQEL